MTVGDVWHRSVLRRAALRYAERGWKVTPGAYLIEDRYVCGPLCPTVACHPALNGWEGSASSASSDVERWWAGSPFSVLLATGHAFDVIEVPARIGLAAVQAGRVGPVALAPTGRWMFLVAPGDGLRPELAAQLDVVLHGAGSWIPAPPTRTPAGPVRWRISPAMTGWRIPESYEVQRLLVSHAESRRLMPTFTTTSERMEWVA